MQVQLTVREKEQCRQAALKKMRERLELEKPLLEQYSGEMGRAARWIEAILMGSKFGIVVIAVLAALASSVRTIQTASEIYTASGTHPIGVMIAAVSFTVAVEGALFTIALAEEGQRIKMQMEGRTRRIITLKTILHHILLRAGLREPQEQDLAFSESGNLSVVTWIALMFAIASNAYMGIRPLLREIGSVSIQEFLKSLWYAPANLQLTFIVDVAGIIFPPLMALAAGHLTARFAAEVAEQSRSAKTQYERDMTAWQARYLNPLEDEDGIELFQAFVNERLHTKAARKPKQESADFLAVNTSENGNS